MNCEKANPDMSCVSTEEEFPKMPIMVSSWIWTIDGCGPPKFGMTLQESQNINLVYGTFVLWMTSDLTAWAFLRTPSLVRLKCDRTFDSIKTQNLFVMLQNKQNISQFGWAVKHSFQTAECPVIPQLKHFSKCHPGFAGVPNTLWCRITKIGECTNRKHWICVIMKHLFLIVECPLILRLQ